jgi:hypothetical protein
MMLLSACGSTTADYASQEVAWDTMAYTDHYEKLNGNLMADLSTKMK